MPCSIMVFIPVLTQIAWPVLAALVTTTLGGVGYTVVTSDATTAAVATLTSVEVEIERSEALAASLNRDQTLTLANGEVTVTLQKDARGRCVLHTAGAGKTKAELKTLGLELMRRITQAYVRDKLVRELDGKGYALVEEAKPENRSLQMVFRKWR